MGKAIRRESEELRVRSAKFAAIRKHPIPCRGEHCSPAPMGRTVLKKKDTDRTAGEYRIRPYGWKGCSHSVEYIRSGVPRQPSPAGKVDRGEVQRRFDERRMRRATFCEHTIMGLIEGISYFPKKLPPREIKRYKSPAGSPHPSDSRGFPASPSATFPAGEGYKTSRDPRIWQCAKAFWALFLEKARP